MRIFTFLVFLSLLGTGALRAQKLEPAGIDALLQKLQERQNATPGVSADFIEVRKSRVLTEPMTSSGELQFMPPGSFRREIIGARPSTTVSNGRELWIYYPKFKEAEKYVIGAGLPVDDAVQALLAGMNFEAARKAYNISVEQSDKGYLLELQPRTSRLKRMFKTMSLTLDENLDVVRSEVELHRGDQVTTTFQNIKRGAIPAARFDFRPAAGVRTSEPGR